MIVFHYRPVSDTQVINKVTWADGSDEEIVIMIAAADNGDIDLGDYWSVGDERIVRLGSITGYSAIRSQSEQDITLVLMNEGYPGTGNERINFVVGQKGSLKQACRMNNSDTNTGSWNDCGMRMELNNLYLMALPETLRRGLKYFNVITAQTYNGSTNQTSQDYVSLFAEKEFFGSRQYSNSTESNALTQIEFFKTATNRSYSGTWLRSPYYNYNGSFCWVYIEGGTVYQYQKTASSYMNTAPFMCI